MARIDRDQAPFLPSRRQTAHGDRFAVEGFGGFPLNRKLCLPGGPLILK